MALLAIALPVSLWFHYRWQHVFSRNAAVRGHVAEIGTRISGVVAAVTVDAGDRVRAGDVLVRLEDRQLAAAVEEARAAVAGLQRTIDVERMTVDRERRQLAQLRPEAEARIAAANARAEAARVEAEGARRNHELFETLHARDGVVSTEELRDAESKRRAAEARFNEAQANAVVAARSAEQGTQSAADGVVIRQRGIAVLEANLLAAQARLTRAEDALESAAIRAPENGAIVRRIVEPGGAIAAGQPVISMWLGSDLWVEAWINEDDLGAVHRGAAATVAFQSIPGREFTGRVDRIGLSTDLEIPPSEVPQPRSSRINAAPVVGLRIRLDDPPTNLVPGVSAVVAIQKAR
ncbi:MAG TPA: efflux RND transporter periplasmic adaptor subunit [Gemmatimonadales bacterium]|nr:efflux RND transporter periplasmic adaptor subunit [Gemmatimonadales bacterium]